MIKKKTKATMILQGSRKDLKYFQKHLPVEHSKRMKRIKIKLAERR